MQKQGFPVIALREMMEAVYAHARLGTRTLSWRRSGAGGCLVGCHHHVWIHLSV